MKVAILLVSILAMAAPVAAAYIAAATRLGGHGDGLRQDQVHDLIRGADGKLYVRGTIATTDFIGIASGNFTNAGQEQVYVARLNAETLAVEYVTVVGRRSIDPMARNGSTLVTTDRVEGMAVTADGTVYVAAYAMSSQFPLTGGSFAAAGAKAIFRVDATGSVTQHSAAIDPAIQSIRAVAVDAQGSVYFSGFANEDLATTPGAVVARGPGIFGPYVVKLDATGRNVAYATYLSPPLSRSTVTGAYEGNPQDRWSTVYAMTLDGTGALYLTGQSIASAFPVTAGSPDTSDHSSRDAFVAKLTPTASALAFVARFGGSEADRGTSIVIAPDGDVIVGGKTLGMASSGNVFQPYVVFNQTLAIDREYGFLTRLSPDGKTVRFLGVLSSYGGNLIDPGTGPEWWQHPDPVRVAVDASGAQYAAGNAFRDREFLLQNPVQLLPPSTSMDGFVLKTTSDGRNLTFATRVGAGDEEHVTGLALDPSGNVYVAGYGGNGLQGFTPVHAPQASVGAGFVYKIAPDAAPLTLTASPLAARVGETVRFTASFPLMRGPANVEFRRGSTVLGSVPLFNGAAEFSLLLPLGIHNVTAILRGGGTWDGHASSDVAVVVQQSSATP